MSFVYENSFLDLSAIGVCFDSFYFGYTPVSW